MLNFLLLLLKLALPVVLLSLMPWCLTMSLFVGAVLVVIILKIILHSCCVVCLVRGSNRRNGYIRFFNSFFRCSVRVAPIAIKFSLCHYKCALTSFKMRTQRHVCMLRDLEVRLGAMLLQCGLTVHVDDRRPPRVSRNSMWQM